MIAPYTLVLHGVMAILCLISLAYLFYKKSDANSRTVAYYFSWFLFFFLYNIFLVLPLILFRELDFRASSAYALALVFLAVAAWSAMKVGLNIFGLSENSKRIISFLYIFGAVMSAAAHFYASKTPSLSWDGKWVFWYGGGFASYAYIFFMFAAGWIFAASIMRGFSSLRSYLTKIRASLLFSGAFILPFAAFYYFRATELAHIYLAFLFSIIGLTSFMAGNLIGFFKKEG